MRTFFLSSASPARFATHKRANGFTIIELITVLIVMAFVLVGMMGVTIYSTMRAAQVVSAAEMNLSFQTTMRYITNELRYSFQPLGLAWDVDRRSMLSSLKENGTTRNIFMMSDVTVDSLYTHPTLTEQNFYYEASSDPTVTHRPHPDSEMDQMPKLLGEAENLCVTYRDTEFPMGSFATGRLDGGPSMEDAILRVPQIVDFALHAYIPGSPVPDGSWTAAPRMCIQERVLLEPTARYGLARVPQAQMYSASFNSVVIATYPDLCSLLKNGGYRRCDMITTPN